MTKGDDIHYGDERSFDGRGYNLSAFVSPHNSRIRILDYNVSDFIAMKIALLTYAMQNNLGKIFFKARQADVAPLEMAGFSQEAVIRGYFNGDDGVIMSMFPDGMRAEPSLSPELEQQILQIPNTDAPKTKSLPEGYSCRRAEPSDIPAMSQLLAETFDTYPFPVAEPKFLRESMESGNIYRLVMNGDTVAAMAAAEINFDLQNAELTDFATRPDHQKKGLALVLRQALERDLATAKIPNQYTLARAFAIGMNRVFAHGGYEYTGTLRKNCSICGTFEDMTCWTKRVATD